MPQTLRGLTAPAGLRYCSAVLIPNGNHGSIVTATAPEYPKVLDIITDASAADIDDVDDVK